MQKYELMLMLFPDLGDKGTTEAVTEVKDLLASFEGKILHEDVWGVKDLAYRIKKRDQGYYVVWNLDLPGEHISEIERALNINQAVMRYLLIKTPVNYSYVSMETYQKEAAKEDAEKAREREEAEAKTKRPAAKPRPKAAAPAPKAAPAPAKPAAKKKEESPEEVDAKLKSIIDDPDISL